MNRLPYPDLTGFYEHRPQKGKSSAIVLQINQAGRSIVGWFTGPPSFVTGNLVSDTVSRKSAENGTRVLPGVFVAFLEGNTIPLNGVKILWRQTAGNTHPDPTDPMAMFSLDPADIFIGGRKEGFLRLTDGLAFEIGLELALSFIYDSSFPIHDLSRYDRFIRVSGKSRLPNENIRNLSVEMQYKLIAEQVSPLSESYIEIIKSKIAPLTTEKCPVDVLLESWYKNEDPLTRMINREKISNYMQAALETNNINNYYATTLYYWTRSFAANRELTINNEKKTYYDWYKLVVAEEMDHQRALQKANPKTAPPIDQVSLIKAFKRVGFNPPGTYLYTFSFSEMGTNLADKAISLLAKFTLSKIAVVPGIGPGPGSLLERDVVREIKPGAAKSIATDVQGIKDIIKLKGAFIKMDVKKERAKLDSNGGVVLKNGAPDIDTSYANGFDTAGKILAPETFLNNGFVGIMGEVGAGLSLNATDKLAITGSLKKTAILSDLDLSAGSFAYSMIRGVFLAGPGVKLGDYLNLNIFSSRYFEVALSNSRGGFSLSTSETETLKFKKIKLSDLRPKWKSGVEESIQEYNKKWTEPQVEAKIIELSGSWAWVMPLFDATIKTPQARDVQPKQPLKRAYKYSFANTEAFFAVNSSNLDAPVVGNTQPDSVMQEYGLKSRDILELQLACNRIFFTSSDASMTTIGLASPEQSAAANLVLSERRAKAVEQAVKDALGSNLKIHPSRMLCIAKGETVAVRAGLRDPDKSGLTRKQFADKYPDEVLQWPFYRRVDLFVDDVLVATVKA